MKTLKNNEGGYIVLITVLILEIIVVTVTGFILISGEGASISSIAVKANTETKAAAGGCAQLALAVIQANPTSTTAQNGSETLSATTQTSCTYSISGTSPNYVVTSSGNVKQGSNTYTSNLTVTLTAVSPQLATTWQYNP